MKLGTVTLPAAGSNSVPAAPAPGTSGAPGPAFPQRAELAAQNTSSSPPPVSAEAVRQAAARINEFLKSSSISVEFIADGRSNKIIVRVVDSETNQVIRQIPSEEALAVSRALDGTEGLLFSQKA